ncbi:MAG: hypothetical protein MI785_24570 [Kiloniellales bacterium]|nr:hypothetical protein [Kiloniellales bacterium]
MSRLIEAAQRLKAATDALERAAVQGPPAAQVQDPRLSEALAQARRENQELGEAADQVAVRLDRAIKRIQSLLET